MFTFISLKDYFSKVRKTILLDNIEMYVSFKDKLIFSKFFLIVVFQRICFLQIIF